MPHTHRHSHNFAALKTSKTVAKPQEADKTKQQIGTQVNKNKEKLSRTWGEHIKKGRKNANEQKTPRKYDWFYVFELCTSWGGGGGTWLQAAEQLMALMAQMVRWSPCQWQATTSTTSCGPGLKDIAGNMQEYTRILLMYGVQSFSFSLLSSTVFYVCEEMSKEHSSSPKGEPILVVWRAPKGKIEYQTTTTKTARTTHAHTHTHSVRIHKHTRKTCVWENLCICHKIIYQLEKFLDSPQSGATSSSTQGSRELNRAKKNAQALYKRACESLFPSLWVCVCAYLRVKLWQEEIKKHKFITGQTMTTKTWPQARREPRRTSLQASAINNRRGDNIERQHNERPRGQGLRHGHGPWAGCIDDL